MFKLNRKGFTLVEMLAVVVILGILATIMIPTVTTLVAKNKNDNYDNLKKSIVSAAKIYVSDNRYNIILASTTCSASVKTRNINKIGNVTLTSSRITLKTLVNSGDLSTNSDGAIYNPITDKKINLSNSYVVVKYNCSIKDYEFGDPVIK